MISIHLATLGCPKNMVDSRHLLEAFISEGFVHTDDPRDSDIILVNTCGFIKDATQESISEILELARLKTKDGSGPHRLVVFGCLAKRYKDELLKEIPEIDAIWGVGEDRAIIDYCKSLKGRKRGSAEAQKHERTEERKTGRVVTGEYETRKSGRPEAREKGKDFQYFDLPGVNTSYAYLKIAEGCDKKCTFCVIPSIRGKFHSIAPESILKEAGKFVQMGVKELILVAQDITNYGKEWKNYGLISLLKDLAAIEGDFWIRLLYLYPTEITDDLLDFIAGEEKICKYLDIPLQHSEDRILRLMGRRGSRKEYTKLIRAIRRRIPGVALRTTFIVGFPSETEEDFRGLADFIEETKFDRLGVFSYSKEEGSSAANIKGQVPEKVKKRRLEDIMMRQAFISLEKNRELIGKTYRAIVDEVDKDVIIGRLCSHAPEIDGVVIIHNSPLTPLNVRGGEGELRSQSASYGKSEAKVGEFVNVEIVDAYEYDVKGKLIDA